MEATFSGSATACCLFKAATSSNLKQQKSLLNYLPKNESPKNSTARIGKESFPPTINEHIASITLAKLIPKCSEATGY